MSLTNRGGKSFLIHEMGMKAPFLKGNALSKQIGMAKGKGEDASGGFDDVAAASAAIDAIIDGVSTTQDGLLKQSLDVGGSTRPAGIVRFSEGVQSLYVGDPHGVRNEHKGRHHNQRMAQWEYSKDKQYLQEKCSKAGIVCFSGSERGTSSHCPRCDQKKKPRGRNWACRRCGFVGHRDIVGSMNMHPLAFGSRIAYPTSLTYRRPGPLRDRRQDQELPPSGTS